MSKIIDEPPGPRWKWTLCDTSDSKGGNVDFLVYDAPSWFHRLMQRLILGICWEKLVEEVEDGRQQVEP